jgi:hypothetical protein
MHDEEIRSCLDLSYYRLESITELIGLYRSVINKNLDKLHLRCDRLNHGLKYFDIRRMAKKLLLCESGFYS